MIALGTAKAALTQFARYLAQELGPQGITVNVVEPGPVADTRISHVLDEEQKRRQMAATPLGRLARPADVAQRGRLLRRRGQHLHDRHHRRGQRRNGDVLRRTPDGHHRSRLRRAWPARGTGRLHRRPGGLLRRRGRARRAARRLRLGRAAAAPRRHHRARPGAAVPADQRHPLGRAHRQHRPSAVLVPRPVRPDLPADLAGKRLAVHAPHTAPGALRPHRAAPGRPRPAP